MAVIWVAVAVLFLVDAALFWVLRHSTRVYSRALERTRSVPAPSYDDAELRSAVAANKDAIDDHAMRWARENKLQTIAIAEGIERVDRSERRVAATVARAEKKLAESGFEDPGIQAELEGLHLLDGDRIGTGGVPPLQPSLDDPGDRPSSIPGVTVAELRKVRGL